MNFNVVNMLPYEFLLSTYTLNLYLTETLNLSTDVLREKKLKTLQSKMYR